jgi:thioredoxin 1
MIYRYIIGVIVGGVIGGVLGHFGKCASGTCPLTSSPIGGVIFGVLIGLLITSTMFTPRGEMTASEHLIEIRGRRAFNEVLNNNETVLVDFYSNRSEACVSLEPIIRDIAAEYSGRVAVAAVNVGDLTTLAQEFGVGLIPEVRIFRAGKLVRTIVGLKPKKTYTDILDSLIAQKSTDPAS